MPVFRLSSAPLLTVFTALLVIPAALQGQPRESVLDRVVRLEDDVRDVPAVERLETGLDLTVRSIVRESLRARSALSAVARASDMAAILAA